MVPPAIFPSAICCLIAVRQNCGAFRQRRPYPDLYALDDGASPARPAIVRLRD
jgi:hypothetical protein